jgi:Flp pilus assembly protein TadB
VAEVGRRLTVGSSTPELAVLVAVIGLVLRELRALRADLRGELGAFRADLRAVLRLIGGAFGAAVGVDGHLEAAGDDAPAPVTDLGADRVQHGGQLGQEPEHGIGEAGRTQEDAVPPRVAQARNALSHARRFRPTG